jgi:hypothetical protein
MCLFQKVTFEMYPSEPGLKGDYYQPGETDEQYRKRQFARRREQRESNSKANASEPRRHAAACQESS